MKTALLSFSVCLAVCLSATAQPAKDYRVEFKSINPKKGQLTVVSNGKEITYSMDKDVKFFVDGDAQKTFDDASKAWKGGKQLTFTWEAKKKLVTKIVFHRPPPPPPPELADPAMMKVGDVGHLSQNGRRFTPRIVEIFGEKKMEVVLGSTYFIVDGFPTKGLADNQRFEIQGECRVAGTEKIGTRTLLVVRPNGDQTKIAK